MLRAAANAVRCTVLHMPSRTWRSPSLVGEISSKILRRVPVLPPVPPTRGGRWWPPIVPWLTLSLIRKESPRAWIIGVVWLLTMLLLHVIAALVNTVFTRYAFSDSFSFGDRCLLCLSEHTHCVVQLRSVASDCRILAYMKLRKLPRVRVSLTFLTSCNVTVVLLCQLINPFAGIICSIDFHLRVTVYCISHEPIMNGFLILFDCLLVRLPSSSVFFLCFTWSVRSSSICSFFYSVLKDRQQIEPFLIGLGTCFQSSCACVSFAKIVPHQQYRLPGADYLRQWRHCIFSDNTHSSRPSVFPCEWFFCFASSLTEVYLLWQLSWYSRIKLSVLGSDRIARTSFEINFWRLWVPKQQRSQRDSPHMIELANKMQWLSSCLLVRFANMHLEQTLV